MENPLEVAEKLKADKKRAVSYLNDMAGNLASTMGNHWANGFYALAASDCKQLSAVLDVLGQIDLKS